MEVRLSSVLHCCCKSLAAPVALSEKYCASVDACNISVWCLPLERETRRKSLVLTGHSSPVLSLAFGGDSDNTFLCSASVHYVFVWDIERCLALSYNSQEPRATIVSSGQGSVQSVSFSQDSDLIAACIGKNIQILKTQSQMVENMLEGHTSLVTAADFYGETSQWVVSVSEDRTFKIWDIAQGLLVYQSSIVSSASFTCLCIHHTQRQFAVGSSDGKVRVYDLTVGNGFRSLREFDLSKFILVEESLKSEKCQQRPTVIDSRPSWKQIEESSLHISEDKQEATVEIGNAVIGLAYCSVNDEQHSLSAYQRDLDTGILLPPDEQPMARDEISGQTSFLIAVTQSAVLAFDYHSCQCVCNFSFQKSDNSSDMQKIVVASTAAFSTSHLGELQCVLYSPFQESLFIVCIQTSFPLQPSFLPTPLSGSELKSSSHVASVGNAAVGLAPLLTVLSRDVLLSESPLKAELVPKPKVCIKKGNAKGLPKRSEMKDRPLTFHSKVKSSGYSTAPRTTMFTPNLTTSRGKGSKQLSKHPGVGTKLLRQPTVSQTKREYVVDSAPPIQLNSSVSLSDNPVAITQIKYSDEGQHLACCLSDGTCHYLKTPLTENNSTLRGHNGSVTSLSWSCNSSWLLTSSTDKTARLWSVRQPDNPLMTISQIQHNFKTSAIGKNTSAEEQFSKEISDAQFFYVDKFFLVVSGNCLYLYKYYIDTDKPDDVKRYVNNSRYKLVKCFTQESTQQITAMSCINDFYSYIVLCAGSNKNIEVYDMNVGRSARVMTDVHSRPVHCISQNKGSAYVSHPPDAYDLFITGAVTDGIKLWDLRTDKCVRRYEGHANRFYPVGMRISPCSRFIGTGSEDKAAYLYDVRFPSYAHKLLGQSDIVSAVAFHPLHTQFVAASVTGKLKIYKDL